MRFTYLDVGATASTPPARFAVDLTRVELGSGKQTFEIAKKAITEWKQFALGWVEAVPTDTAIREGETVAVVARAMGFWWLNAARIVYVIDEHSEAGARFGFAYGTLPGHVESGEERFLIEWDRASDQVHYDILAFSRPRHILTRIGRRQVRHRQLRFGRESSAAMQRTVADFWRHKHQD